LRYDRRVRTSESQIAALEIGPDNGRGTSTLLLVWLASAVVIVVCTLALFRLGFAEDLRTALLVNGPRVLLGAGVGAALALSGALRLATTVERPLRELEILAVSTGAAAGGFLLAQLAAGTAALVCFAFGALGGAGSFLAIVRSLDRSQRWTNLLVAAALAAMAGIAALVGTYVRERRDIIAPAVTWLLGDLGGASFASGLAVVGLAVLLGLVSLRVLGSGSRSQQHTVALLSLGLGVGAAGPLAFVGTLAPRTVRWLARGASERALLPACAAAGAATVVAVDSIPRLLLGGYDFPWNLPAAMLALPIFLGWNRVRLRRAVGATNLAFEILELVLLAGLTVAAVWLAIVLTRVIRAAT
jgi:ABC-type Fe3+-siderophore transport system permease subunit